MSIVSTPIFIGINDVVIPLEEIKYARFENPPGTVGGENMLIIYWKHGGHVCIPGCTTSDLIQMISNVGIQSLN